jgi:hypothetical protein
MRLTELDANFVGKFAPSDFQHDPNKVSWGFYERVSVADAQGLLFVCPKCQHHSILIMFANPRNGRVVPNDAFPKNERRWTFSGDTIDKLTLSPSVDLSQITPENPATPSRCYWHGWVKNGDAQ